MPRTTKTGTTKSTTSSTKKPIQKQDETKLNLLSQIKIDIKHKNEIQKKLTTSIKNNEVTICVGPAGTGKTILSVAEALLLLKNNSDTFHNIRLVKSIVQLKNEDLGTLPGDEKDKLKFIMMSFLDAFYLLIGEELTHKLMESGFIKMEILGSIRGRSIPNSILLFDEFQNVTHSNAKTLLTRFSENTKVVILGDTNQIDLKNQNDSCLKEIVKMVNLMNEEEGVEVVEFKEEHIVRHRLTKYFVELFEHPKYKETQVVKLKENITKEENIIKKDNFLTKLYKFFK